MFTERTQVVRLEGGVRPTALWKMARAALASTESSIFEVPGTIRAFRSTMDAMWPEVSRLNLIDLVPALEVPVFFLLGRNDHFVPPETSLDYFETLTAPSKTPVWFDSGHEPFVDEPDRFDAATVNHVLPVATSGCAPAAAARQPGRS